MSRSLLWRILWFPALEPGLGHSLVLPRRNWQSSRRQNQWSVGTPHNSSFPQALTFMLIQLSPQQFIEIPATCSYSLWLLNFCSRWADLGHDDLFTCPSRFQRGSLPWNLSSPKGPRKVIIFSLFSFYFIVSMGVITSKLFTCQSWKQEMSHSFNCFIIAQSLPTRKFFKLA